MSNSDDENGKQVHPAYHEYDPSSAPHLLNRKSVDAPQVSLNGGNTIPVFLPEDTGDRIPVTDIPGTRAFDESTPELDNSPKVVETKSELHGLSKGNKNPHDRRRKRIFIGVAICAILVVAVAAIVGGVLGSRKAHSNSTKSASSSTNTAPPQPSNTGYQGPGTTGPITVNDAWAYNGTSLAALTFSTTTDTSGTNYLVFYQHSNGDIRQAIYNNTVWHDSEFVTNEAHPGTPLAAFWKGDDFELHLFYFDKNRVLQELRGKHGSDEWLNGTLGSLSIMSQTPSSLTVWYPGTCLDVETAWVLYHTGIGTDAQMVYWNADAETWDKREVLDDFKLNAGFAAHDNDGVWAIYYTSDKDGQLKELVCPDCCTNSSSTGWRAGLNGPKLNTTAGGIAVANTGPARLVYYPSSTGGMINELNNTLHYPDEVWVDNVSTLGVDNGGNSGTFADPKADVGPPGVFVASGIPNGQVAMAPGFRGTRQEIWLFYQKNGTDVTVQTRYADAEGDWSDPVGIPVAR